MIILIIILIIGAVSFLYILDESNKGKTTQKRDVRQPKYLTLSPEQQYYASWKNIGLTARRGYQKFTMVGMEHRCIGARALGKFEGYAVAQTDNPFDKYAIAIFREDAKHVGFLRRENIKLHRYIAEQGGMVHCYGYIACNKFEKGRVVDGFYAEVCVETDMNIVNVRNKAYDTSDKFYKYEKGKLKEALDAPPAAKVGFLKKNAVHIF